MRALFLGNVAADTAHGIRDVLVPELDVEIVADPKELTAQSAANADIVVSNHWRADYPRPEQVALMQSVATGIDLIDLASLPRGVPVCNVFGHETAIAEYVLMVMLAWAHRFREIEGEFRTRASWNSSWVKSGEPHGEIRGKTLGIIGFGRVGREVARRAAPFGCRILAVNRTAREPSKEVERVYPLTEIDDALPAMRHRRAGDRAGSRDRKPDGRAPPRTDEALRFPDQHRPRCGDRRGCGLCRIARPGTIAGAALDVWWQYPNAAEPERRGSRHPFEKLPNVIMTPHNSGWTDGMNAAPLGRDRR